MTGNRKLYMAEGTLKVKARGYWFTAGGEKGSFGYVPHLKDNDGLPLYPDTQLHGDLRMAAQWLDRLKGEINKDLIEKLFGKEGNEASALLRVNDLSISPIDRKDKKQNRQWFEIKTRIWIDDNTGTVKEHKLVDMEYAFYGTGDKSTTIESRFYLGYFKDEEACKKALVIIEGAAKLLSGFGAFRSRGYGRGEISITNSKTSVFEFKEFKKDEESNQEEKLYFLEALVHFRNKPIEPGSTQIAESIKYITVDQLRGWFVRAYNSITGMWPTMEQMVSVRFADCYRSDKTNKVLGYPAANTTLRKEDDSIDDYAGRPKKTNDENADDQSENFLKSKLKPLTRECFFTDEAEPRLLKVDVEKRMRNSMDEKFTAKEKGLFAQELIKKGTIFGARIKIDSKDDGFASLAWFIFSKIRPVINGAVFEPSLESITSSHIVPENNTNLHLVVSPILYKDRFNDKDGIMLTTIRRYNTTLKRPRRNRIVIAPGSVLSTPTDGQTIKWNGFGKYLGKDDPTKTQTDRAAATALQVTEPKNIITRAQAGILRDMLNPDLKPEQVKSIIDAKLDKYVKSNRTNTGDGIIPKALWEELQKQISIKDDGIGKTRAYIQKILDELAVYLGQKNLEKKETQKAVEKMENDAVKEAT